jgi:hypothetical protein
MVSRMAELRAEIGARRRAEESQQQDQESTGEIRQRLSDRERLEEMESRGLIKLGTGRIPEDFWDLPAPEDPRGEVLGALLDEREEGR